MKNFIFKFEPIHGLKKQLEESCKNELGKAVEKYENEKKALKHIKLEKAGCLDEMKEMSNKNVDVIKMRQYNSFLETVNRNIIIQE